MIEGVIYKYTSPSGKSYIGQTTNEKVRREKWYLKKVPYAGEKIERARRKYGAKNFTYEVLERRTYPTKEIATEELNKLEIYYIGLYDTYRNGYNCTIGGEATSGYNLSEEIKVKIGKANKGREVSEETKKLLSKRGKERRLTAEHKRNISRALKSRKNTWTKNFMSSEKYRSNLKAILQINVKDGSVISEYSCVAEACEVLGLNKNAIYRCLCGLSKTSFGFKWVYKQ